MAVTREGTDRLTIASGTALPASFGTTIVTGATLEVSHSEPEVQRVNGSNSTIFTGDSSTATLTVDYVCTYSAGTSPVIPTSNSNVTLTGFPNVTIWGTADAINEVATTGKWKFLGGSVQASDSGIAQLQARFMKYKAISLA